MSITEQTTTAPDSPEVAERAALTGALIEHALPVSTPTTDERNPA